MASLGLVHVCKKHLGLYAVFQIRIRIRMDLHVFDHRDSDPDPQKICGSGSGSRVTKIGKSRYINERQKSVQIF